MSRLRFSRWDCRQGFGSLSDGDLTVTLRTPKWKTGFWITAACPGHESASVRLEPSASSAARPGLAVQRLLSGAIEVTLDRSELFAAPGSESGVKPESGVKSGRARPCGARDAVLQALRKLDGQTGALLTEACADAGHSARTTERALQQLLAEGLVVQDGSAFARQAQRRGRLSPIYRLPGSEAPSAQVDACPEARQALQDALGDGATSAELSAATGLGRRSLHRLLEGVAELTFERRGRARIWRPLKE